MTRGGLLAAIFAAAAPVKKPDRMDGDELLDERVYVASIRTANDDPGIDEVARTSYRTGWFNGYRRGLQREERELRSILR